MPYRTFAFFWQHKILIGFVVAVAVAGASGTYGGYKLRDWQCKAAEAETVKATADAMATLAHRYTAADTAAAKARREHDALRREKSRSNINEAVALPDRGCGWTADDIRLLDASYCAAFPGAAGCVPVGLRLPGQASEGG